MISPALLPSPMVGERHVLIKMQWYRSEGLGIFTKGNGAGEKWGDCVTPVVPA